MSCGGGGGGSVADVTIGGTGQGTTTSKPVTVTAPIDSFSSIVVGGVVFDIEDAITSIDGQSSNTQSLQAGMWVEISGNISENQTTGTATNIIYSSRLAGPIKAITSDNMITVNGISVILADDIQYDDELDETLSVNLQVALSGSYDGDDFSASYIGPNEKLLSITKTKSELENEKFNMALSSDLISVLRVRLEAQSSTDIWQSSNIFIDFSNLSSDNLIDATLPNQELQLNKSVLIHAFALDSQTLKVTQYQVIPPPDSSETEKVTGTITELDSEEKEFTIQGETYHVNSLTKFNSKKKKNFGFKDLEVGLSYEVDYFINNENDRVAKRIKKVPPMNEGDNNGPGGGGPGP